MEEGNKKQIKITCFVNSLSVRRSFQLLALKFSSSTASAANTLPEVLIARMRLLSLNTYKAKLRVLSSPGGGGGIFSYQLSTRRLISTGESSRIFQKGQNGHRRCDTSRFNDGDYSVMDAYNMPAAPLGCPLCPSTLCPNKATPPYMTAPTT